MSLVDKLMAIDSGEYAKEKTKVIKSKALSEYFGEDTNITIKAISAEEYMNIAMRMVDSKGNADFAKTFRNLAFICSAGIVEPNLADPKLQKHFGAVTSADLAIKLFKGGDLQYISTEITKLSGFGDNSDEEEVKN